MRFALPMAVLAALPSWAISVRQSIVSTTANDHACTPGKPVALFQPSDRQAFLWFTALDVRTGDQIKIEWLDPQGNVAQSTPYGEMPNAPALCFLTQMPIAGFEAAEFPGEWQVRVEANGAILTSQKFRIAPDPFAGRLHITNLTRSDAGDAMTLLIDGGGFAEGATVHLAQYSASGGWSYIAHLKPSEFHATRMLVKHRKLAPGEYMVLVRNPDQSLTQPFRLLVTAVGGYKLPLPAGEPWMISQGPYGSFSHFNRTLHAWDIAPLSGRCVVAMRAGIAYTFDLGLRQTPRIRSFGNYITIRHDNGEFSHYAHLQSGGFQVQNGQRVEQGQALAIVGNSGYTFGPGGGHHIHVQVTRDFAITSPSIPFRFDDLPLTTRRVPARTVVSTNASPLCNCRQKGVNGRPGKIELTSLQSQPAQQWTGKVEVTQWWSELLTVEKGAPVLDVTLRWEGDRDLDLHLTSPSGVHYGWYGNTTGFSGQHSNPQSFRIPAPEPGIWRVSVRGIRGPSGPLEFHLESRFSPSESRS